MDRPRVCVNVYAQLSLHHSIDVTTTPQDSTTPTAQNWRFAAAHGWVLAGRPRYTRADFDRIKVIEMSERDNKENFLSWCQEDHKEIANCNRSLRGSAPFYKSWQESATAVMDIASNCEGSAELLGNRL